MGSGFIRGKGPGTQVKSAIASNVIILCSIARRAFLTSANNDIATRIKSACPLHQVAQSHTAAVSN